MSKYFGKLGGGHVESERPVVLFDDVEPVQSFDTVKEAEIERSKQASVDKFKGLKGIFEFNPAKSEYERQS